MKKITIFSCIALLICMTAGPVLGSQDVKSSKILATVGDSTFSTKQLATMVQTMPPQLQAIIASNPAMKEELITRWVDFTILVKEAEAIGLDKEEEMKIKIDELRRRVLVEALIDKRIKREATLPEKTIKAYYDSHPGEFEQGEQVKAQHILIRIDQNASAEADAKAKETITMVAEKNKKGESFEALAQEYSEDPGSKINGGDLGFFSRGQMVKEFEDAAFSTELNTVSNPVRTAFGYHLIKVTNKKAADKIAFVDVKQQIETTLLAEKNRTALSNLISQLKEKYEVKIY